MELATSLVAALSLGLALLAWIVQVKALSRKTRCSASRPGVSILKPMKGADPGLEENLRSVFRQAYPAFEILLGVQDERDPAVAVARKVMAEHPLVPARLVISCSGRSPNPKVDNLRALEPLARHDLLLISDSNVRVGTLHLCDLVAHLGEPGVGLVSSPIRACGGTGLGATLESLQMNVFVMGGALAWTEVFRQPCVVGKSMLLRRPELDRIGGFAFLGQFLAEDQVSGQEVAALGLRVVMTGQPVDNVLGRLSLRQFAGRHLRWARLRFRLEPLGYLAEPLLNPVAMGLLASAASGTPWPALLALAAMTLLSGSAERRLGLSRTWALLPVHEAARAVAVAMLWPVAMTSSRVSWRGNALRISRRTRLVPISSAVARRAGGTLQSPEWRRA